MDTTLEVNSAEIRERTQMAVKQHKASWIRLGQYLFTIRQDKHWKTWGYQTFEGYCRKELHIKQATATKLLKSYSYLEKEKPQFVDESHTEEAAPQKLPDYESVNVLRLAEESQKLTPQEVVEVRTAVFDKGREPKEVKAQVKQLIDAKDVRTHEELMQAKRNTVVKRLVTLLKSTKTEFQKENLLPDYLIKQMGDLVDKLEDQLE